MTTSTRTTVAAIALAATALAACIDDAGDGASAQLVNPEDGAVLHGPVALEMAAEGIEIEAAGEARDDAGHFHVIADGGCAEPGATIGADADHVHFGRAQTDGVLYLGPGQHDLCLQVGDGVHTALDVTDTVTVTVQVTDRAAWCDVMADVDEGFRTIDDEAEFSALQLAWENQVRLLSQLTDAIDLVDEPARDDVAASLEFGADVARAFTAASDEDEAFAALDELYAAAPAGFDQELPGAAWIEESCDIDISD